jgi:hypothetical protein
MTAKEKFDALVEAYGFNTADCMVIQSFGTIDAAYKYAVEEGVIEA